jgi:hypothetical protein
MDFDKIDKRIRDRRKEWMFPLGILFIVMATIILVRNLILITTEFGFEFFIDNFFSSEITNEKFAIVMYAIGSTLVYFGRKKRLEEYTG